MQPGTAHAFSTLSMLQVAFFTDIKRFWLRYLFLTFLSGGKSQDRSWRCESQREGRRMNNETVIKPRSSCVSISYSTFPPILFSVTLPISINIRELYLLPCGTWTRAGLWQAHRSAGKWLQRRARSAAHSPGTWAQGFQVGRNPTLQPFSVHLSPLLLSKRLVTARGRIQSNFLHHPFWHSLCVTQK